MIVNSHGISARADSVHAPGRKGMTRILCAIDLADGSTEPLKYAAAIQRWYGGCVTLLHVVPTFDAVEVHTGGWFDPATIVFTMSREEVVDRLQRETKVRYEPGYAPGS